MDNLQYQVIRFFLNIIADLPIMLIFLVSATFHEVGHGYAAYRLGDHTAKDAGRLTLNPLKHVDLFGTIIFPIMLSVAGFFPIVLFKPVPINPANLRDPVRDGIKVAFAGPGTNILLVLVLILLTRLLNSIGPIAVSGTYLFIRENIIVTFILVNLIIIIFNLIPFPPLDGSWILRGILPPQWRFYFEKYKTYLFIFFFILVITGKINFLLNRALKFFYYLTRLLIG
ncbi:MAG: site-2 protease family protein [bacterium]|nr:site-2 protease family protein [bacterium]